MSLEAALLDILQADPAVNAVVGSNLRHEWRDQNDTEPGIVLSRVSATRDPDLTLDDSLVRCRMQVDCFERSFEAVRALADNVIAVLNGYSGAIGAYTIDSVRVDNETSLGEQDGDHTIRRVSIDFIVIYV